MPRPVRLHIGFVLLLQILKEKSQKIYFIVHVRLHLARGKARMRRRFVCEERFRGLFLIFWLNRIVVGGDLLHVNYASSKQRTKGSDSLIKEQTTLRAKSKPPSTAANMTAGAERAPRNVKS